MFYLLENNRIIDSNTLFTKNIPLWEVKDNLLFAKSKNGKLIKPYKYNAIKNQSENVFELIEVGDLVMVDRAKIYPNFYKEPIIEISQVFWSDSHHSLCIYPRGNGYYCPIIEFGVQKGILAIFKPDDKGNYIKVWERKDEK